MILSNNKHLLLTEKAGKAYNSCIGDKAIHDIYILWTNSMALALQDFATLSKSLTIIGKSILGPHILKLSTMLPKWKFKL